MIVEELVMHGYKYRMGYYLGHPCKTKHLVMLEVAEEKEEGKID